jgi:hypothetical protein
MKKTTLLILLMALMIPLASQAKVNRVDLSPMVLYDLSSDGGDTGDRFIGGALAGDVFFSQHFALRATVGYVRNRYDGLSRIERLFTDLDPNQLGDESYSIRLSIAPYVEANVGGFLHPYVTFSGTYGYTNGLNTEATSISSNNTAPISNGQFATAAGPGGGFFSLSGSLGFKAPIMSRISLFAEINHEFYSDFYDSGYYVKESAYRQTPFGFDNYDTFLSAGLSYRFDIVK